MADKIITHPATPEYRENWERIFGKDKVTRPDTGNGYDASPDYAPYVYDHIPGERSRPIFKGAK